MEKKRFFDFPLQVKVLKDYIVVHSPEFNITLTAGSLLKNKIEDLSKSIGNAVIILFTEMETKLEAGEIPTRSGKTVSMKGAVSLLGISATTVRRFLDQGKLHAVRTAGNHRRIYQASIDAWLKKAGK